MGKVSAFAVANLTWILLTEWEQKVSPSEVI